MQLIVATIKPDASSPAVLNLQDALFALLDNKIIKSYDEPNRPTQDDLRKLAEQLQYEREQSNFGKATRQLLLYFQIQQGLGDNLKGIVEEKTAFCLNEILKKLGLLKETGFIVRGTVFFEGRRPDGDITVVAFDRDLRIQQKLDEAKLDTQDNYRILYQAELSQVAEQGRADIVIEVHDRGEKVIAISDIVFNAPPDLVLNVTVLKKIVQISEYEQVIADVLPLLKGQGPDCRDLTIDELTADDQSFIVNETGLMEEQISKLVFASQSAKAFISDSGSLVPFPLHASAIVSHGAPFATQGIPVEAFYGWFRVGLPQQLSELLRRSSDELMIALDQAIKENFIPVIDQKYKDLLLELLDGWRIAEKLKSAPKGEPTSFCNLLGAVKKD